MCAKLMIEFINITVLQERVAFQLPIMLLAYRMDNPIFYTIDSLFVQVIIVHHLTEHVS